MADNEAAVPRFGEWNDRDATAPDNYTAIFNRVREGRQEAGGAPALSRSNVNSTNNQDQEHNQKKCCCFPWPRKR